MKVALLYLGRRGGGAPYSLELARALSRHVTLRAFISNNVENYRQWFDGSLNVCSMDVLEASSPWGVLRETLSVIGWLDIRRKIAEFQPDIVHATMVHPWLPLVLGAGGESSRTVVTVHDPTPHRGEASLPLIWLNRICTNLAHRRVVLTASVKQSLVEQGLRPDTIDVVPHGELSYYQRVAKGSHSAGMDTDPVVLFFGRIVAYKGLDSLLEAFPMVQATIPRVRLVVAGAGNLGPYSRLLERCPNLEVHNRWISEEEVSFFFSRAALVVVPYAEASQSGVVPIAAAMGVPVVATNVGGLGEQTLASQAGILVPPGDPVALAGAMTEVLSSASLHEEISRRASATSASQFNWNHVAKLQVESYRRALAKQGPVEEVSSCESQ